MIAELLGGNSASTLSCHDSTVIAHEHSPAWITHLPDFEPKHITVEGPRTLEVWHRKNEQSATDLHGSRTFEHSVRTA
jgi:hypothetical protein